MEFSPSGESFSLSLYRPSLDDIECRFTEYPNYDGVDVEISANGPEYVTLKDENAGVYMQCGEYPQ
jgi:hypothetical protein